MVGRYLAGGLLAPMAFALMATAPAEARSAIENDAPSGGDGAVVRTAGGGYLQCVPYARRVTGIEIFGDAHTWWGQASGRFGKGSEPRVGAVMALRPHGNSRLGHVAAVSKVIDSRTVLIRHANWSQRGKIEDNVRAVDASPGNDWSEVRVWYGPAQKLGAGHWPLYGFIYKDKSGKPARLAPVKPAKGMRMKPSDDFIGDIIAGRVR
jgi:surface antigen